MSSRVTVRNRLDLFLMEELPASSEIPMADPTARTARPAGSAAEPAPGAGRAVSSPPGSACPDAPSATTSSACAISAIRSTPTRGSTGGYRLGARRQAAAAAPRRRGGGRRHGRAPRRAPASPASTRPAPGPSRSSSRCSRSHLRPTVDALCARASTARRRTTTPTRRIPRSTRAAARRPSPQPSAPRSGCGSTTTDVPCWWSRTACSRWHRRWYLVGRDPADAASGAPSASTGWSCGCRPGAASNRIPLPGGDYTAFAMRTIAVSGWNVHARLRIDAPAEAVLDRIHAAVGVVEPVDDEPLHPRHGRRQPRHRRRVHRDADDGLHRRVAARAGAAAAAAVGALRAGGRQQRRRGHARPYLRDDLRG